MATEQESAKAFAQRLRRAMEAKGYTSARSRSGIDVNALAKGAGVSYEMARRYAEGLAMPRPDVLRAIATWTGVDAAALAYGKTDGEIDAVLLESCIAAVGEAQASAVVNLTNEQIARLVAQLYGEARRGLQPSPSSLAALLRTIFKTKG